MVIPLLLHRLKYQSHQSSPKQEISFGASFLIVYWRPFSSSLNWFMVHVPSFHSLSSLNFIVILSLIAIDCCHSYVAILLNPLISLSLSPICRNYTWHNSNFSVCTTYLYVLYNSFVVYCITASLSSWFIGAFVCCEIIHSQTHHIDVTRTMYK